MKKLVNVLRWFDENILKILLVCFIFIVPLYPKLPFIDLEYTYISVRLEDFFVMLLMVAFGIQWLRKKVTVDKRFLLLFVLFWGAVFLSFLSGVYLTKTIPVTNIGFLHGARRVEYMAIFFVAFATVKSRKDLYFYLQCIIAALIFVGVYGIGQKFFGWPAVQTMNPEFARGHFLFLTPEARVSSTFGGHYDLAAYLVFLMPLIFSLYLAKKKIDYFVIFVLGIFILILTASRISSIAYIVSITPFLLFLRKIKLLIVVLVLSIGMSMFSTNLVARWSRTFQVKQIFVNEQTGQVVVPQRITSRELPAGSFYVALDQDGASANATSAALLKEQLLRSIREEASKSGRILTAFEEEALYATASAGLKPVNTVVSDISFATRIQVEWPRAIKAFLRNPVLGTGSSSITEATDNDYLRWIGEFGLLGTLLFLTILFMIVKKIWDYTLTIAKEERTVYYGFLFGMFGLLFNALYIDVFEASKVAYQFWLTTGIFIATASLTKKKEKS